MASQRALQLLWLRGRISLAGGVTGSTAGSSTLQQARWLAAEARAATQGLDPHTQVSPARRALSRTLALVLPASIVGVLAWGFLNPDDQPWGAAGSPHQVAVSGEQVVNWSSTHSVTPKHFYQPETQEDVEAIVADCAAHKRRLRVLGSGLSPNGVGFSDEGMMSMGLLDKILWIDPQSMQVRVEAGCRVQQVADALKPYGLSLANYASIREQQIGGFTQVSAHGTGAAIPPVDEQVVALKLVTPAGGVLELNADNDPELFRMARVGLGCLGVVTELTLQAVPMQRLREKTFVASGRQVARNHASWLRNNRHLRYMWIPYTDSVVVVQVNPEGPPAKPHAPQQQQGISSSSSGQPPLHPSDALALQQSGATESPYGDAVQEEDVDEQTLAHRLEPLRSLLLTSSSGALTHDDVKSLSATELRDALLVLDPLNRDWVAAVNRAEAEFWKRSAGQRLGYADQILGFDCGGQQWVLEVAFPIGSHSSVTNSWRTRSTDIKYMQALLAELEAASIPAPAPIEQRWTAASASPMSPAGLSSYSSPGSSGQNPSGSGSSGATIPPDSVFSWVGVIMYLPSEDPQQREAITQRFAQYAGLVQDKLMPKFNATWHWAKIEPPHDDPARLAAMRAALAARFPLAAFNSYRAKLDPDNILGNKLLDSVLGMPAAAAGQAGEA